MCSTGLTEDSLLSPTKAVAPDAARSSRLCKVVMQAGHTSRGITVAASAEDAIRLLEERARAEQEGKVAV